MCCSEIIRNTMRFLIEHFRCALANETGVAISPAYSAIGSIPIAIGICINRLGCNNRPTARPVTAGKNMRRNLIPVAINWGQVLATSQLQRSAAMDRKINVFRHIVAIPAIWGTWSKGSYSRNIAHLGISKRRARWTLQITALVDLSAGFISGI